MTRPEPKGSGRRHPKLFLLTAFVALRSVSAQAATPPRPPPILEDEGAATESIPDPEGVDLPGEIVDGWRIVRFEEPPQYGDGSAPEAGCGYQRRVIVSRGGGERSATLSVRCLVAPGRLVAGAKRLEVDPAAPGDAPEPAALTEPPRRGGPRLLDLDDEQHDPEIEPGRDAGSQWNPTGIEAGLVQVGAGLGVATAMMVCGTGGSVASLLLASSRGSTDVFALGICVAIGLPLCGGPALIAVTETLLGNLITDRDVGLLGPVLAAYAGLALGTLGALGGALACGGLGGFSRGGAGGALCALAACGLLPLVLVLPIVLLPAIIYSVVPSTDSRTPAAGPPTPAWGMAERGSVAMAY